MFLGGLLSNRFTGCQRNRESKSKWKIEITIKEEITATFTNTVCILVFINSPYALGPVLANIFMCDFEEKWLTNTKISPSFWNRYVDDTFTMFHDKDSANELLHYLKNCHSNIKLTIEFEQNNAVSFFGHSCHT